MANSRNYERDFRNLLPLRYISNLFLKQALDQIEINMSVQRVWPFAPYSVYPEINEYRRQHRSWYSTGEGIRSFEGVVYEADENTGMVTMGIRYNDYMQYVDIGVGAGRKSDDVERSRKVRYKSRYTSWQPGMGKSHRPVIRPEANHLATRLENYVRDYYSAKLIFGVEELIMGNPVKIKI